MPHSSIKRQVLIWEPKSEPEDRLVKLLRQTAEKAETVSFATGDSGTEH